MSQASYLNRTDGWVCMVGQSSQVDQLRPTGSISYWFGMWRLHQINVWNLARRTCCLKASLVEGSIVAVCWHGHGEAHSLCVSTSLSFFPRECAEAFKELCNTRNKGTEEPCNARSNKSRRGVQVVKEYLYSQCQDGFDLSNVPDHLMNITTSQNAST